MDTRLIQEILSRTDQTQNLVWALAAIFLVLGVIREIVAARNIDRFRSDLKKGETQFTLYNQLQVKALSLFFTRSAQLYRMNEEVLKFLRKGYKPTAKYKQWEERRKELIVSFADNQYLFPSSMETDLEAFIKQLKELSDKVDLDLRRERCFVNEDYHEWAYAEAQDEHGEIIKQINSFNYLEGFEKSNLSILSIQKKVNQRFKKFEELSA